MKKVHFILGAMLMLTACNDIGDSGTKMSNCGEDLDFNFDVRRMIAADDNDRANKGTEKLLWHYDPDQQRLSIKNDNFSENCGYNNDSPKIHRELKLSSDGENSYILEKILFLPEEFGVRCLCWYDMMNSFDGIAAANIRLKFVKGEFTYWEGEINLNDGDGTIVLKR